jgi:endonuclease V-like protein UPF0215 family
MIELVERSQFAKHLSAVMLQGIAVGGFNVVDVQTLSEALGVPVLVVTRKRADLDAVRRALFSRDPTARPPVPGAARKWKLIEQAGPLEPLGPSNRAVRRARAAAVLEGGVPPVVRSLLWIQRVGLSVEEARRLVEATTLHGHVPEPLRLAHLIAGGIVTGRSRGRA